MSKLEWYLNFRGYLPLENFLGCSISTVAAWVAERTTMVPSSWPHTRRPKVARYTAQVNVGELACLEGGYWGERNSHAQFYSVHALFWFVCRPNCPPCLSSLVGKRMLPRKQASCHRGGSTGSKGSTIKIACAIENVYIASRFYYPALGFEG